MGRLSVYRVYAVATLLVLIITTLLVPRAAAQSVLPGGYFREVRWIETAQIGVDDPTGLAYSAADDTLLVLGRQRADSIAQMHLYLEDLAGEIRLEVSAANPLSITFDSQAGEVLVADPARRAIQRYKSNGRAAGQRPFGDAPGAFGARNAPGGLGITFDPQTGRVYTVDADGSGVTMIEPAGGEPVQIDIQRGQVGMTLRGIAFNPADRHLFAMDPHSLILHEFSETGELLTARNLQELGLRDPQAMVFAPSGDNTDDPAALSLYIADSGVNLPGGGILELSMIEPQLAEFQMLKTGSLVRTMDLSRWSPPAPDPSGIAFWYANGTLLVSDGEVDEMPPYFTGKNLYESTTSGTLLRTNTTTVYSKEPVGAAVNPVNNHLFFSDDNARRVFEIDPGADQLLGTADDARWYFSTSAVGSNDPEGLGYGGGHLFIVDGTGSEVYVISPGPNNRFDGIPPTSDDQLLTHFDTSAYGISDPEGIDFNPETGTLFIAGNNSRRYLLEMMPSGAIVDVIDIGFITSMAPAGVAVAPGSINPAALSIYIADRRVDNGTDPYENDGRIYEVALSGGSVATPTRTATATQTSALPTATFTQTPTPGNTASPTATTTQTPTRTPTLVVTSTPTRTPTPLMTNTPTITPTHTPTRTPTTVFTATGTPSQGGNLALNRPVTVSSIDPNNNGEGKNAVDGNLTTRWKSLIGGTLPAEWIIVDLGQAQQISRVVLRWNYYATAYTIDVSNDGQAWTTVYSTTTGNGDPDDISFSPVTGRYVRMYSTAWYRSNQRIYLREFEIYH